MTLDQRLKGGEGVGQMIIWMKSVSVRENSQCKVLRQDGLGHSRSTKEARVARVEGGGEKEI